MHTGTFRIKKPFIFALTINVILIFILLLMALFLKGSYMERIFLALLFFTSLLFLLESMYRKVSTEGTNGISIRKFLKEKSLLWEDITHVGTLILRKRAYLLLTSIKGFHIITNAYELFPQLVKHIVENVDKEKIDDNVKELVERPIKKKSDVLSLWLAAIVLSSIIYIKITSS